MTNRNHTALLFLAMTLTLLLQACGGGGSSDGSSAADKSSSTESSGTPPVAATEGVFAAPKACAEIADTPCVEPTSSRFSTDNAYAVLNGTNSSVHAVQLRAYGYSWHAQKTLGGEGLTFSSVEYDSGEKAVILKSNAVVIDSLTYSYNAAESQILDDVNTNLAYKTSSSNGETFSLDRRGNFVRLLQGTKPDATNYASPIFSKPYTIHSDTTAWWSAGLPILSDYQDAALVADDITYEGYVWVYTGDASPNGVWASQVVASCPITLSLNINTGLVTFPASVECYDSNFQTKASISFLRSPTVRYSRIEEQSSSMYYMSGVVSGPIYGTAQNPPAINMSSAFEISKIGGAIYGSGAHHFSLAGSGTNADFEISANRK